jgi:hypothetical protein
MSAQDEIYSQNSDGIWLRYEPIGLTTNVVAYRDDTHDVSYYTGNLTIPASFTEGNETYYVKQIGNFAFSDCSSLTSVSIPSSVTYIDSYAFLGCSGLTSVQISDVAAWCKISFADDKANPLYYARHLYLGENEIKDLVVPNSVTSIRGHAFYRCSGLTSVTIPNSVTSIGTKAFSNCSNLTSVTIGSTTPPSIYSDTFVGLGSTAILYVPSGSKVAYEADNNWKSAFKEIVEFPIITFADANVKAICLANWDANGDGQLSEAEAAAVTSLGDAFYGNNSITSFDELQYFTGLSSIVSSAFSGCTSLTSVIIPNNVKLIGGSAFSGCRISSITIPYGVTSIGGYAFYGCDLLALVTIPNSVLTIGNCSFRDCSSLYSLTIPNSVTSIGEQAFDGCHLTAVRIPSSVTTIGSNAFYNCGYLTSVIVEKETPVSIDQYTFTNRANATLYVPYGSVAAYENADYWKGFKYIKVITEDIIISSAGMGTFCSTHPLDFSGTDDIKAYIVSAFKPSSGEVTLTRITDVPANTGIVVKGDANNYSIPWGSGTTVVANLLVGVTEDTQLNKVDGDYTNYILAKKSGNLGFYAVTDGSTLSAGKAYLPLPTNQLPAGARQMTMIFDDETTGIQQIQSDVKSNGDYYDLQGRRVSTPTRGLYIVNGKKVVIK